MSITLLKVGIHDFVGLEDSELISRLDWRHSRPLHPTWYSLAMASTSHSYSIHSSDPSEMDLEQRHVMIAR